MVSCCFASFFIGSSAIHHPPTRLEPISNDVLLMNKRTAQRSPFDLNRPLPLNFLLLKSTTTIPFSLTPFLKGKTMLSPPS